MIIGTTGFSWSGSSAIADLLKEFEDIQVYADGYEFILPFFPDGLADLDYHLNKHCAKFVSSTVAIPRFRKVAIYLLEKPTHGKINNIVDAYLDKLIQVKWLGLGQGQYVLRNDWCFRNLYTNFTAKIIRRLPENIIRKLKLYPLSNLEFSIRPKDFEEMTQIFINEVLQAIGLDTNKDIVLDQPFPGNNPVPFMKYFRDSKAIIVDRDPRELYLLAKEYFPKRSYQIPHENVNDFINYYKFMHSTLSENIINENVLYLHFEDLVYEYEPTVQNVISFLGLGEHINKKKYFDPNKSVANTKLFIKCDKYRDDIRRIEEFLPEYLFDFDKYYDVSANGRVFNDEKLISNSIYSK